MTLDGKPIGTHRFTLADDGGGVLTLESEAHFHVTLLGLPIYTYRHRVVERWAAGCLQSIDARTDDDGKVTEVRGRSAAGRFAWHVTAAGTVRGHADTQACVMSFAYWNPALAVQTRLLDPGSGELQSVVMEVPQASPADLRGQLQPVRGLRIGGLAQAIDVWYAGERWIGLDTTVRGGRHLSYRLR